MWKKYFSVIEKLYLDWFFILPRLSYIHVAITYQMNLAHVQVSSQPPPPTHTHTHTHTHTCNPSQPQTVWHTVYTIRILHAIGDRTLWCTTCNRGRFVYEYDSSLITGDVTFAHKYLSFVNVIYIRFAIDCSNSQGGDHPRFQNVPGLNVECHTYVPGWRRLQTHTHTHTHMHENWAWVGFEILCPPPPPPRVQMHKHVPTLNETGWF